MLLSGKVALVTGANRGIGLATARLFAQHGATVFVGGRRVDELENIAHGLRQEFGVAVHVSAFDVSVPDQVKVAFQDLFKTTKRLDVLVNNAGLLEDALIGMVTPDQIEQVFSVNTYGVLYASQYASRLMARNNGGSIVNLASIIGTNGNVGQAVYGGSKAAVIGITKSLAKELADKNIRVNAVAPGFIDTDMARSIPAEKFEERLSSIKMGRIGTAFDVANVNLFLASELASYVTGQIIGVDGGMLI